MVRNIVLMGFASVLAAVAACSPAFLDKEPGQTLGKIVVKSPIVSTRERLVNDRYDQDAWLRGQLDGVNFQHFGFDALSDVRSFVGQFSRGAAKFQSQALASTVTTKDGKEVKEAPETGLAAKDTDLLSPGTLKTQAAGADKFGSYVADPKTLQQTQGQASPKNVFRDRRDLRGEIRNEILENQLDDRHDLNGRTLYRLSFDATVKADSDTSAWAEVGFEITDPAHQSELYYQELYADWLRHLRRELQTELSRRVTLLNKRSETKNKKSSTTKKLENDLLDYFASEILSSNHYYIQFQQRKIGFDLKNIRNFDSVLQHLSEIEFYGKTNDGNLLHFEVVRANLIADQLIHHYNAELELNKFVGIQWINLNSRRFVFPRLLVCHPSDCFEVTFGNERKAIGEFWKFHIREGKAAAKCFSLSNSCYSDFVAKLKEEAKKYYSYAVTPKEAVQRISDVATRRRAGQLLLSLGLQFKELGIDAVSNSIKENQGIFQTINRLPIVVGYGDQDRNFGWIIGPKFNIGQKSKNIFGFLGFGASQPTVNYRHSQVQKRLTAVLSVPAWWDQIRIKSKTMWRKENGETICSSGKCDNGSNAQTEVIMSVDIPPRLGAITAALSDRASPIGPVIDADTGPLHLMVNRPANVIIRGKNLWRSTKVTLGNQVSRKITVLPDMGGIVAEFGPIVPPADWTDLKGTKEIKATVWTSEDHVDLPEGAFIYPPIQQAALVEPVRVKGRTLIRNTTDNNKAKIQLTAPVKLTARHNGLTIGIRVKSAAGGFNRNWTESEAAAVGQNLKAVTSKVEIGDSWNDVDSGTFVETSLFVTPRANATQEIYPALGELVYYKTTDEASVRLASSKSHNANDSTLAAPVEFTLPKNMVAAFPGVARSGFRISARSGISEIKLGFKNDGITSDGKLYKGTLYVTDGIEKYREKAGNIVVTFSLPDTPAEDYPAVAGALTITKAKGN